MAKNKIVEVSESLSDTEIPKGQNTVAKESEIEVVGVASAEKYQKEGWRLISVTLQSDGKHYKFRK